MQHWAGTKSIAVIDLEAIRAGLFILGGAR